MWARRVERINELLLHEISRLVAERQDPEIGFVTFTGVKITEDLMEARVYYSVLGTEEERVQTENALYRFKPELRRSMRRLESLRRIPDFHFEHDGTLARAARVHELLSQIHNEQASAPPPAADAVAPSVPSAEMPPKKPTPAASAKKKISPKKKKSNVRRPASKKTR